MFSLKNMLLLPSVPIVIVPVKCEPGTAGPCGASVLISYQQLSGRNLGIASLACQWRPSRPGIACRTGLGVSSPQRRLICERLIVLLYRTTDGVWNGMPLHSVQARLVGHSEIGVPVMGLARRTGLVFQLAGSGSRMYLPGRFTRTPHYVRTRSRLHFLTRTKKWQKIE